MRNFILATVLFLLVSFPGVSQSGIIYLPLLVKDSIVAPEPILRIRTQDGKIVDILEDWEIADPYWRPQIAKYKGDGNYVDSAIADGSRLVFKKYANVIETIPLVARGTNQAQAIDKLRGLLQVNRQSADYWTEPYEYDYAWLEARPACNDCRTGYARIVKANVPELNNPFGQPFFSATNESVMDELTLIIEREPLWRGVQPGTLIGPLINVLKNPDFELWNFGVTDSQPDSWSDLESTTHITGANSREDDSRSGNYSLKVRVSTSTQANRFKGVSQVIAGTRANTTYTVVAWVRNDGVTRGVGRILVTYASQLELYRDSVKHGWQLYTGTFTTGASDTVAISLEILTTAANTDGTVYFDSLMLLEGDWQQEAIDGMLPYMTSSHIVNHWDQAGSILVEAGDINYVDMWDVPGDESALVRLEMINETPDAETNDPVPFSKFKAGLRRTGDIFNFTNFYNPAGIADTTAAGDDRVNSGTLGTDWLTVGFFTIDDAALIRDNLGRFRVLARVWDTSSSGALNLEVRLRYWIGHPFDGIVVNRFYMLKDRGEADTLGSFTGNRSWTQTTVTTTSTGGPAGKIIQEADLFDATNTVGASDSGWMRTLRPGEKIVSSAIVVEGTAVFSSNQPTVLAGTAVDACASNLGVARVYTINVADGGGTSVIRAGGGYVPSPVFAAIQLGSVSGGVSTIPPDSQGACVGAACGDQTTAGGGPGSGGPISGIICTGTSCWSVGTIDVGSRRRSYWYKEVD